MLVKFHMSVHYFPLIYTSILQILRGNYVPEFRNNTLLPYRPCTVGFDPIILSLITI